MAASSDAAVKWNQGVAMPERSRTPKRNARAAASGRRRRSKRNASGLRPSASDDVAMDVGVKHAIFSWRLRGSVVHCRKNRGAVDQAGSWG